ncbi:MAG: dihydroorotate dehydrogenase [Oscillospiraceae bacterium]|nr:dihydroorotate dehydrogenase [Oscillospiraceae bacterium]
MADLRVNFAGVEFENPIVTASGTYGFGREYGEYLDLNDIGGICVKGLTLAPRQGNKNPRIVETAAGMLNSVGLQNPGVDAFIETELPWLRQFRTKVIANVCGNTVEDYVQMTEKLVAAGVDILEINISCPNVKEGGLAFGVSCDGAESVTKAVKRVSGSIPVMVKLSPNVTDIVSIAKTARDAGADALSLINTLLGMRINYETMRPMLANNMGGLSGPAVLPVAIRMVYQVAANVDLPILGMGGVSTGMDVAEMMIAGADLVALGTACFVDPLAPVTAKYELDTYLDRKKISRVTDLTGRVELNK